MPSAAQAGDHDVGEVLADAALQLEGLERPWCRTVGRLGVVGEVVVDAEAEIHAATPCTDAGRCTLVAGIGGDRGLDGDAGEAARKWCGESGASDHSAPISLAQAGEVGRQVEAAARAVDRDPRAQPTSSVVVVVAIGDRW